MSQRAALHVQLELPTPCDFVTRSPALAPRLPPSADGRRTAYIVFGGEWERLFEQRGPKGEPFGALVGPAGAVCERIFNQPSRLTLSRGVHACPSTVGARFEPEPTLMCPCWGWRVPLRKALPEDSGTYIFRYVRPENKSFQGDCRARTNASPTVQTITTKLAIRTAYGTSLVVLLSVVAQQWTPYIRFDHRAALLSRNCALPIRPNRRKVWMGEVVNPAPAADSAPTTISMTWADPCDVEVCDR